MRVIFTARQTEAIDRMAALAGGPLNFEMHASREDHKRTGVIIDAPYIAWALMRHLLLDQLHKRSGARNKSVPRSQASATQRVVEALNTVDRHPAFREVAMAGIVAGVFPAWRLAAPDIRGRKWSPSPIPGADFRILMPGWYITEGFTRWWAMTQAEALADPWHPRDHIEQVHLQFIGL